MKPTEVFDQQTGQENPMKALMRMRAESQLQELSAKKSQAPGGLPPLPNEVKVDSPSAQMQSPFKEKQKVSQKYGAESSLYNGVTSDSKHHGLDLATPEGTQVFAPMNGNVETGENKWYGKYVKITSPDGTAIQFSHLSNMDDLLKQIETRKQVLAGQLLGLTGNTGYSTGPHVDIQAYRNGQLVDPMTLQAIQNATL